MIFNYFVTNSKILIIYTIIIIQSGLSCHKQTAEQTDLIIVAHSQSKESLIANGQPVTEQYYTTSTPPEASILPRIGHPSFTFLDSGNTVPLI